MMTGGKTLPYPHFGQACRILLLSGLVSSCTFNVNNAKVGGVIADKGVTVDTTANVNAKVNTRVDTTVATQVNAKANVTTAVDTRGAVPVASATDAPSQVPAWTPVPTPVGMFTPTPREVLPSHAPSPSPAATGPTIPVPMLTPGGGPPSTPPSLNPTPIPSPVAAILTGPVLVTDGFVAQTEGGGYSGTGRIVTIIQPGDTIEIQPRLKNVGDYPAMAPITIVPSSGDPLARACIDVGSCVRTNGLVNLSGIAPGQTGKLYYEGQDGGFTLVISQKWPHGKAILINLDVTDQHGHDWPLVLSIPVL
jgi:hypothetical protein